MRGRRWLHATRTCPYTTHHWTEVEGQFRHKQEDYPLLTKSVNKQLLLFYTSFRLKRQKRQQTKKKRKTKKLKRARCILVRPASVLCDRASVRLSPEVLTVERMRLHSFSMSGTSGLSTLPATTQNIRSPVTASVVVQACCRKQKSRAHATACILRCVPHGVSFHDMGVEVER